MSDDPVIEERENGPFVAKGLSSVEGSDGTAIEAKPIMALCRCGHSKNKPFCDGSHNDAGFQSRGGEPAGKDKILTYAGTEISVTYNPRLCSHAAECGRLADHIFNPKQKPWVQPDNGTVEEVRAVVAACPSGALALAGADGPEQVIGDAPQLRIEKNGPYWVTDVPPPVPVQGEGGGPRKYVLCRCGLSGNKPFCDGTHKDVGWRDGS